MLLFIVCEARQAPVRTSPCVATAEIKRTETSFNYCKQK